jgi:hypothetical protein
MHVDSVKEMERRFSKVESVGVEPNSVAGMFGGINPLSSTGYALSIFERALSQARARLLWLPT